LTDIIIVFAGGKRVVRYTAEDLDLYGDTKINCIVQLQTRSGPRNAQNKKNERRRRKTEHRVLTDKMTANYHRLGGSPNLLYKPMR